MGDVFLNCWEVKKCGREPGGELVSLYGVCPVSTATSLDGVHGGKNGGRCCWIITPLLSDIVNKTPVCTGGFRECLKCDFYKTVLSTTRVLVKI